MWSGPQPLREPLVQYKTVQPNIPTGFQQRLSEIFWYWQDLGLNCFSCGATLFTACMGNISMTYCASFCISRLCPLLYITACEPGINHFLASLLHEMKEFIMVTVGRCEAFTVIYLGKMIDSLTLSEQCFTMGAVQRPLPHAAVCVQGTCLQYGGLSWASQLGVPCSSI